MNSTIVEYIEGIEVIKAFGRSGVSYEKYANAINAYRTFVIEWMSSTWGDDETGICPVSIDTFREPSDEFVFMFRRGADGGASSSVCHAFHVDGYFSGEAGGVCKQSEIGADDSGGVATYLDMAALPEPETTAALSGFGVD